MRITPETSVGLVIDVQSRLLPAMADADRTLTKIGTLVRGLQALRVPFLLIEQYRKGLGPTVEPLTSLVSPFEPIEKASFSCCDDAAFESAFDALGRSTVLIAGIESHVCVLQTALDLAERGATPVVVADATSSRNLYDRDIAFQRLTRERIRLTTVESVLFELTRVSGTLTFKAISQLIK